MYIKPIFLWSTVVTQSCNTSCQMRRGATQHPRRWIVLVLVHALIEVDLIQIAQKGKPVQGNPPLRAPFFDVLLELHA